jgi:uncharacterized protein
LDTHLIISNLRNPTLLFFLLGLLAVVVKSDLKLPQQITKFISLYLLFSIGFKGGLELAHNGFTAEVALTLGIAIVLALVIPVYSFFILKLRLNAANAGAIAATYGSVSAVTFVTAASFLADRGIPFGGHMVAAMALMESPAIIIGIVLIRLVGKTNGGATHSLWSVVREGLTNGSVLLIVGSLVIGMIADEKQAEGIKPFTSDIFKGFLALFLLEMGMVAGRRMGVFSQAGGFLLLFGVLMPFVNAGLAIGLCHLFGIDRGNAFLLAVLAASASYIAVPAALRLAVPQAEPGLYIPMALVVTFPVNIVVGLPLYYQLVQTL